MAGPRTPPERRRRSQVFQERTQTSLCEGKSISIPLEIFQLFRASRGQQEFVRWIGRYQALLKRLMDAWMDLHEIQTDEAMLAIP